MARYNPFVDRWGQLNGFGIACAVLGAIVALITVLLVLCIGLERHYGRIHCQAFARNTGRTTKFVVQSYVDGGVCLTPSGKGRWIPTSQLRDIR